MGKKSTIIVKTQFENIHKFLEAPNKVDYLRFPHRHLFYVEIEMEVFHNDRELEFIMVKHHVDNFLRSNPFEVRDSCETMATQICEELIKQYGKRQVSCAVLEDNENGGKVYYGY